MTQLTYMLHFIAHCLHRLVWMSILAFTLSLLPKVADAQTKDLQIEVREKGSKLGIPGVVVSVDGQNKGITDSDGRCTITFKEEKRTIVLSLSHITYARINALKIDTRQTIKQPLVVYLEENTQLLDNVTVTARQKNTTVFQQSTAIEAETLERHTGKTLGNLLEKVPGVSSINTGSTISKPVIQGMHSSRILLINNGVRLESQSWGADHAPEIDHTASGLVEVIKGAEAIRYGYGAMGGVVLFSDAPLPYGHDKLTANGNINLGYASNARGYDGAGTLTLGYKNVGLRFHGIYQQAGDYSTADYILNNTGYKNISFSGMGGFENKHFTATIAANLYYTRSGIYYASKISDIDQLLARFRAGRPDEATFAPFSYRIKPPFQQSQHFTLRGEVTWRINPNHKLNVRLSYQDNLREEFEDRKNERFSWVPVQDLQLTTYGSDVLWTGKWKLFDMETQVGFSSLYQWNYNVPGTKQPAFIPNYTALTLGAFWIQKARIGKWQASMGLRYDARGIDVNGYTSLRSFKYYEDFKAYNNVTANIAIHYQITDHWDVRSNVGLAWRPPDVNELYASGLHHGTYWVEGNRSLKPEHGIKAVLGGRYRNEWLSIEPVVFYQYVDNYIYDNIGEGTNRFHNHPSGKYPKFIYGQDKVRLYGGDLTITSHPIKGLELSLKGEWMNAFNITQSSWLPFMPSDRYTLSANYAWPFRTGKKWKASFGFDGMFVTKQNRFDPAKDLVPDSPPAYFLLNVNGEVSYALNRNQSIKFLLTGDNILNNLYKEYTDRFRYYAHAMGSNITLRAVYNF